MTTPRLWAACTVGSLLTLTIASPASDIDIDSSEAEAVLSAGLSLGASASFGQSRFFGGGRNDGSTSQEDGAADVAAAFTNLATASVWERFVLGLDEAFDTFREEFQGRMFEPWEDRSGPDTVESPPTGASSAPDGPTSWRTGAAGGVEAGTAGDWTENVRGTGGNAFVDAAIHALWDDQASLMRPLDATAKLSIRLMGTDSGIHRPDRQTPGAAAFVRKPRPAGRDRADSRQVPIEDPSRALVLAAFVTGGTLLARPHRSRFHRAGRHFDVE